jgi:hypothetical protein
MKRHIVSALSYFVIVFCLCSSSRAEQTPEAPTKKPERTEAATPVASPSPTPPPCEWTVEEKISVPKVVNCIHLEKDANFSHVISMNSIVERGDTITVPIVGLKEWVKSQKDHDPHALRLFIAGHLLPKDEPSLIELDQGYINFQLTNLSGGSDADERKAWIFIFNEARRRDEGVLPITAGLPKDLQPFSSEAFLHVRVYPFYTAYVSAGLILLLIALVILGWRSDLLRDTTAGRPPAPARAPFSLGRMQMAWWFFWVIAAYVYICLVTKEVNILTVTALTLIGISAGTGLASVFVDKQKLTNQENEKVSLQSEQATVQSRIAVLTAASPKPGTAEALELYDRQKRLAEINLQLSKFPAATTPPASRGLIDVLTDGEGLSFHRFQIAVWTIVLGLVFIKSAFGDLVMPEFDATLLGLMGISSGTYIGFKFPEK